MRAYGNGWRVLRFLALVILCGFHTPSAFGQTAAEKETAERQQKQRTEAGEALQTLSNLLKTRTEQSEIVGQLKKELESAKEEASKKEIDEKIEKEQAKLERIELQIVTLSTGISASDLNDESAKPFDLQAELEGLAQPIIKMMKDATEGAREIEKLNSTISSAGERREDARRAITRIELLTSIAEERAQDPKSPTYGHLTKLLEDWKKREKEAADQEKTAKQRLTILLDEQANEPSQLGTYATKFMRSRGLNLLLALSAFGGVLIVMNLLEQLMGWFRERQGIPRSFVTRAVGLLFKVATVIAAFLAMLAVFNMMNDWLLLGIAAVFAIGTAWLGLKMLPAIIEQVTLLLNLGAVQEGERVMLAGIPWCVEKLDIYTDLVNPELDGGTFTVPVRELSGLHSRPSANDEAWFPTSKGDWVQLESGNVGRVVSQTPELVQVVELGGAHVTYETAAFVAQAPRNLSSGFRMKSEFGLDYRHQQDATQEIPEKLKAHVRNGLDALLGPGGVLNVDVDLLRADDSAIIFEVEADFPGRLAERIEDIEREIARLQVDACNVFGWTIPFPQMVMHRPVEA